MVRFTLKRSLREESCCSLLVVNGGVALRRRSFFSAERTTQSALSSASRIFSASSAFGISIFLFALAQEASVECRRLSGGEMGVDRPIFFLLEGFDFAFAIDDQAQSDGLHPSGGQAAANFVPQKRRNLIAHQAIQHASGLLRVHQVAINVTRMLKSGLDGALRDFIESHATNASAIADVVRLLLGSLLPFLFLARVFAKFVGKMGGDSFAFAIRIRRKVDVVGRKRQFLQLGQDLLLSRNDDVFGFEIAFDVDPQAALGQVFHVAVRSIDRESLAQIFLDSFRLSRRFDND